MLKVPETLQRGGPIGSTWEGSPSAFAPPTQSYNVQLSSIAPPKVGALQEDPHSKILKFGRAKFIK